MKILRIILFVQLKIEYRILCNEKKKKNEISTTVIVRKKSEIPLLYLVILHCQFYRREMKNFKGLLTCITISSPVFTHDRRQFYVVS